MGEIININRSENVGVTRYVRQLESEPRATLIVSH